MTLKEVLRRAIPTLASREIEEPHLEAELLLRHVLGLSQAQLYLRLEEEIEPEESKAFSSLVERRLRHEPTAYITGHKEFFGLDLYVDQRVLTPRPETELLVEKAIELGKALPSLLIAEVGTGSGAIAIALAAHLPQAKIYALDLSPGALEVAAINCRKHSASGQINLLRGDMLTPLSEPVDLIVANLPYIRDPDLPGLSPEIRLYEPSLALAGGTKGLSKIGRLMSQANAKLKPGGVMLLEISPEQGPAVLKLAESHFPGAKAQLVRDLSGVLRVLRVSF